jgi:IS1 family transposase
MSTLEGTEQKFTQYKQHLDEYEQKQETEKVISAKKFSVHNLAEDTRKTKTVTDPKLGEINYKLLTLSELKNLKISELSTDEERVYRVVAAMLQKADPTVTWSDFQDLPFDVKTAVTEKLIPEFNRFLPQTPKTSQVGSEATMTPKK